MFPLSNFLSTDLHTPHPGLLIPLLIAKLLCLELIPISLPNYKKKKKIIVAVLNRVYHTIF